MPLPIHHKITGLKQEFLGRASSDFSKLAEVCEGLLELIEQNRKDLTEAYEAQVQTNQRLHELEKVASTYKDPRG